MILNPNKPTVLPGGMRATVLHMSRADMVHDAALSHALSSVIAHEAKAHDAVFQAAQFAKVIEAVREGHISAYFILAGWENCIPKVVGASVEFPTVITKWNGSKFDYYPAIYGEDTCLLPQKLKELVRERPAGKSLPKGLGAHFEAERIRRWTTNQYGYAPLGVTARGLVGEYSTHSAAMLQMLNHFGATVGTEQQGTILELDDLSPFMREKRILPPGIKELPINNGSETFPNISVFEWAGEGGRQQLSASFTRGISTFNAGERIDRVQLTSNGNLPDKGMLQIALASLLAVGHHKMREERSELPEAAQPKSPSIPLLGSHQEIYAALLAMSQDELLARPTGVTNVSHIWGGKAATMRFHAIGEPGIVGALRAMGAKTRSLGPHSMLPVVMDFANIPQEALNFDVTPARPIALADSEVIHKPLFSLAA